MTRSPLRRSITGTRPATSWPMASAKTSRVHSTVVRPSRRTPWPGPLHGCPVVDGHVVRVALAVDAVPFDLPELEDGIAFDPVQQQLAVVPHVLAHDAILADRRGRTTR